MIEKIVDLVINNFDFSFMLAINGLTYFIIKIIDDMNGKKKVPAWQKRLVLIVCIAIISAVYIKIGYRDMKMLLNSAILAPVFWGWIAAPVCDKLGINYKKVNKVINDKNE